MICSDLRVVAIVSLLSVSLPSLAGAQSGKESANATMREGLFVVINHECQYSAWPSKRELPSDWKSVGLSCSFEACLRHVNRLWTDMRPLSIRDHVEKMLDGAAENR